MSQTLSSNPFRPGSGIAPPLLSGRERETRELRARLARATDGHPQHTALLGEWAIGKTTLLMQWRRELTAEGHTVVLAMAYPQRREDLLTSLGRAVDAARARRLPTDIDLELGIDIGVAEARVRRPATGPGQGLLEALRRLADDGAKQGMVVVLIDDIDLVTSAPDALFELRAIALQLYASDIRVVLVVAASPGLLGSIHGAHEPLVRFFEPLTLRPLDHDAAAEAIIAPLESTPVRFEPVVVDDIVELSAGRPYYLQKLAYYAFDAAHDGRVDARAFAGAFERAFAAISQEIFAGRWGSMSPAEQHVAWIVAGAPDAWSSSAVESVGREIGVRPDAARQALRRLVARGHVDRLVDGQRGRYTVADPLFRRYLALQR